MYLYCVYYVILKIVAVSGSRSIIPQDLKGRECRNENERRGAYRAGYPFSPVGFSFLTSFFAYDLSLYK